MFDDGAAVRAQHAFRQAFERPERVGVMDGEPLQLVRERGVNGRDYDGEVIQLCVRDRQPKGEHVSGGR